MDLFFQNTDRLREQHPGLFIQKDIPSLTVLSVTVSHISAMALLGYKKTAMRNPNRKIPWA